jgi:hypothetical protein
LFLVSRRAKYFPSSTFRLIVPIRVAEIMEAA